MPVRADLQRSVFVVLAGCCMAATGAGCSSSAEHPPVRLAARPVTAPLVPQPTISARPVLSPRQAEAAVVRRYFTIINGLDTDMNAAGLAALMTAECPCRRQVRAVRYEASLHRSYVGRDHLNAIRPNLDGAGLGDVIVDFDSGRGGIVSASGRRITSSAAAEHLNRDFVMRRVNRRWLISRIDRL
jgi:hypothetical protein